MWHQRTRKEQGWFRPALSGATHETNPDSSVHLLRCLLRLADADALHSGFAMRSGVLVQRRRSLVYVGSGEPLSGASGSEGRSGDSRQEWNERHKRDERNQRQGRQGRCARPTGSARPARAADPRPDLHPILGGHEPQPARHVHAEGNRDAHDHPRQLRAHGDASRTGVVQARSGWKRRPSDSDAHRRWRRRAMKRLLLTLALSLWLPLAAAAQCTCSGIGTIHGSAPGDGLGPDLPRNVPVTTPLAGDPTQAQVCWDNSSPEFGVLQLTQQLYPPPSSPDVDRLIAGPNSASTHTCVTANHLYPNNFGYGFNIAVNPNGIPTWALTGPAPRNAASPPMSLMPAGNGQANTCVFFTASTSGALAFQTIPAINQQGYLFSTAYGNSAVNIPITNAVTAGPAGCSGSSCGAMRRMVVTSLTADGQACTVASAGGVCGTTHIYTQFLCDNSEALNPATNNYDAGVLTSGPYSGKYFCDNTWFGQGLEFLRYWTDASTTLGVHHLQYQLTALDGSNNVLATATSPSYAVTVLAAPSAPGTPTLTTESADVKNFDWLNGVETVDFFEQFRIANTTLPGVYLNDSASSTEYTYLPTTILSYDGDATALNRWRGGECLRPCADLRAGGGERWDRRRLAACLPCGERHGNVERGDLPQRWKRRLLAAAGAAHRDAKRQSGLEHEVQHHPRRVGDLPVGDIHGLRVGAFALQRDVPAEGARVHVLPERAGWAAQFRLRVRLRDHAAGHDPPDAVLHRHSAHVLDGHGDLPHRERRGRAQGVHRRVGADRLRHPRQDLL